MFFNCHRSALALVLAAGSAASVVSIGNNGRRRDPESDAVRSIIHPIVEAIGSSFLRAKKYGDIGAGDVSSVLSSDGSSKPALEGSARTIDVGILGSRRVQENKNDGGNLFDNDTNGKEISAGSCVYKEGTHVSGDCCGSCLSSSAGPACQGFTGTIGNGSCLNYRTCYYAEADIGDSSCTEEYACYGLMGTTIGDRSCTNKHSCIAAKDAKIGNDSCSSEESCSALADGASVGDGSCSEIFACNGFPGTVLGDSCIGELSCFDINDATVTIGSGSCIGYMACRGITVDVPDGQCIGHTACIGRTDPFPE